MAYSKLVRLVVSLANKTAAGDIQWQPTAQEGIFQASFPSYTVQLSTTENFRTGQDDFVVLIRDKEGRKIDEVSDPDLHEELPDVFAIMRQMYDRARRQALGVDKALDELLGELGEED